MAEPADASTKSAVSPRQRLFVAEYMKDKRQAAAAVRAGYSARTAPDLMSHPAVSAEIRRLVAAEVQRAEHQAVEARDAFDLSRQRVLRQLGVGAFCDIRGFYDERGELIPPHLLSCEQAALIESIEHTPMFEGSGQERRFVGNKITYKIAKRAAYIDMAMKHLGEYKKDNEQAAKALVGSLAELVALGHGSTLLPVKQPLEVMERVG